MGLIPNKLRRRSMHLQAVPINEEKHSNSSQISPSRPSFSTRNSSTFPSSPHTFTTTLEEPYWEPVRDPTTDPNSLNQSTSEPFSGDYSAMSYSPQSPHDYQQGYQNAYNNNTQQSQRPQSYAAGPSSPQQPYSAQSNQNNLSRPPSGQGSNRDSVNMSQNGQQANYGAGGGGGGGYDQQQRRYAAGNGVQSNQRQQYSQQPPPPTSQHTSSHNSSPTTSTPSYPTSSAQPSSSSAARPTSMLPSATSQRSIPTQQTALGSSTAPPTIAGEPLHDMERAISLLKSSKFYAEGKLLLLSFDDSYILMRLSLIGFLMKKVEVGPDGKTVRFLVLSDSSVLVLTRRVRGNAALSPFRYSMGEMVCSTQRNYHEYLECGRNGGCSEEQHDCELLPSSFTL